MRRPLATALLALAAVASAQDESPGKDALAGELWSIAALPTAKERAQASAALARRPDVDVAAVLAALTEPHAYPEATAGPSRERVTVSVDGGTAQTLVHLYVPSTYDPSKPAPLLLALHGTGGSGDDQVGMWRQVAESVGMLVVAPDDHGENTGYRFSSEERDAALGVLRWARLRFNVDPDRVHVTGVSRGGHLSWDLALRHPELFASASPMVGGPRLTFQNGQNNTRFVRNVLQLPIRDLQGANDDPLLVANLRFLFERLEELGARDAELFEFPDHGHSFDLGAVDWVPFFTETTRAAWPERAIRAAADEDEARAFFVQIRRCDKGVSRSFTPRVDPRKWAAMDAVAQRREVLRQVEEATAWIDVTRTGPRTYEAKGENVRAWRLLLPAEEVEGEESVVVRWNGRTIKRRPKHDTELMISQWAQRLDAGFLPVAAIDL